MRTYAIFIPHTLVFCLIAVSLSTAAGDAAAQNCLTDGTGTFRAKLHGALVSELNWGNEGTACTGFTSSSGPVRLQFSRRTDDGELIIDLTIRGIAEGETGRAFKGGVSLSGSALEGQRFQTPAEACTFTIVENTLITATLLERIYKLVGSARCRAPAVTEPPGSEIRIAELSFKGQTRWSKSTR